MVRCQRGRCIALPQVLWAALGATWLTPVFAGEATSKQAAPDPSAAVRRGTALAKSGQCEKALPLLIKSTARVPDKDQKRNGGMAALRCALALNRTDPALDFVQMLNREFPTDPEVLYLTVHAFSDLSIQASQQLMVSAPSSYQVHEMNAEAMETAGRWEEAAKEYREVLKQDPRLPGIHYRLGRLILSAPMTAGTVEDARREFKAELEINPNNPGAEYVLAEMARRDQNFAEAIEHFGRASKLDAGFADAFIGYGRSLNAADRSAEAVAPLERAVKLQPQNSAAHYHLGIAYRRTGRLEDAQKQFALHKQTSEQSRKMADDLQAGIAGPQKAEP